MRVYELAKQLNITTKEALTLLKEKGIFVKSHFSLVEPSLLAEKSILHRDSMTQSVDSATPSPPKDHMESNLSKAPPLEDPDHKEDESAEKHVVSGLEDAGYQQGMEEGKQESSEIETSDLEEEKITLSAYINMFLSFFQEPYQKFTSKLKKIRFRKDSVDSESPEAHMSLLEGVKIMSLPLVIILGMGMFSFTFNKVVIETRLDELNNLFTYASKIQDQNRSLDLILKYTMFQERGKGKSNEINSSLKEAKMFIISEVNLDSTLTQRSVMGHVAIAAIKVLRFLLTKDTVFPRYSVEENVTMYRAYLNERDRNYRKAVELYTGVIEGKAIDTRDLQFAYLHSAFCHSMLGNLDKAELYYKKMIKEYPYEDVGEVARKLLTWIEKLQEQRQEIRLAKNNYDKAIKYYRAMDLENSITTFTEVIEKDSTQRSPGLYYRGRSYEELGENKLALKDYEENINAYPKSEWAKASNRRVFIINKFYQKDKVAVKKAEKRMKKMKDIYMVDMVSEIKEVEKAKEQLVKEAKVEKERGILASKIFRKKTPQPLKTKPKEEKAADEESLASKEEKAVDEELLATKEEETGETVNTSTEFEEEDDTEYYKELAEAFKEAKDYKMALKYYKKAEVHDVDLNEKELASVGQLHQKMGNLEEAEESYAKSLEINPQFEEANEQLLNIIEIKEETKKIEEIQESEDTLAQSAQDYKTFGINYLEQKNFERAQEFLKIGLQLDPENMEIAHNLGVAFFYLKNYEFAELYIKKATDDSLYKKRAKAYVDLGKVYKATKRFNEAIYAFNMALSVNPNISRALDNVVACYLAINSKYDGILESDRLKKRREQFKYYYEKLASLEGEIGTSLRDLADLQIEEGGGEESIISLKNAIASYKSILEQNPDRYEMEKNLISCYLKLNNQYKEKMDYNAYQANLQELMKYRKKNEYLNDIVANAYMDMGEMQMNSGNYEDALTYFDEALMIDPRLKEATLRQKALEEKRKESEHKIVTQYWLWGLEFLSKERYDEAIDMFELAIQTNPEHYAAIAAKNSIELINNIKVTKLELENYASDVDSAEQLMQMLLEKVKDYGY